MRELLLVLSVAVGLFLAATGLQSLLWPEVPRPSSDGLLRRAEIELRELVVQGLQFRILEAGPYVDVVDGVTSFLEGHLEAPLPELTVVVVESDLVNAFAFPGDLIVVHTGLIRAVETPEQLAAVLAHELAHVVYRDSITAVSRQLLISVVLSSFGGRRTEQLVQRILRETVDRKFSREAEARADEFAALLLAEAGLRPATLGDALEALHRVSPDDLPGVLKYLQSHPGWEERIETARGRGPAGDASAPAVIPGVPREIFETPSGDHSSR